MILTFETANNGQSLDVHFDEAGRDKLIELLSECRAEGDHKHLFLFAEAGEKSPITPARYDNDSTAMGDVTLWLLPSDAEPVERITE